MRSPSFKPDPAPIQLDFFEMSKAICIRPRATIRTIVDQDPGLMQRDMILAVSVTSALLAFRGGIEMMFLEFGLNLVLMVISVYATALTVWLTGKPLGGKATFMETCAAVVWPMSPTIVGTLIAFVMMFFTDGFLPDIVQLLSLLVSFHIMNATLAEVQGMSAWTSFMNQLLAIIISLLPLVFFWGTIESKIRSLAFF